MAVNKKKQTPNKQYKQTLQRPIVVTRGRAIRSVASAGDLTPTLIAAVLTALQRPIAVTQGRRDGSPWNLPPATNRCDTGSFLWIKATRQPHPLATNAVMDRLRLRAQGAAIAVPFAVAFPKQKTFGLI